MSYFFRNLATKKYCQTLHQGPINSLTFEEMNAARYAGAMQSFYASKDTFQKVLLYENLVTDPEREVGSLLDLMGVERSQETMDHLLVAMKSDSQTNATCIKIKMNKTFGPEHERLCQKVLDDFGTGLKFDMTIEEFKKTVELNK